MAGMKVGRKLKTQAKTYSVLCKTKIKIYVIQAGGRSAGIIQRDRLFQIRI